MQNYIEVDWRQLQEYTAGLRGFPIFNILIEYYIDIEKLRSFIGLQLSNFPIHWRIAHTSQSYTEKWWPSDLSSPWYMEHFVRPPNHSDHGLQPNAAKGKLWCQKCLELKLVSEMNVQERCLVEERNDRFELIVKRR